MKQTKEWKEFEAGQDYNRKLKLYKTVDINEKFYAGDQWAGVKSNGLSTPVFNIYKQSIDYFISQIASQKITMKFSADLIDQETENEAEQEVMLYADNLSNYSETTWERLKMDTVLRDCLLDGANSGDMCVFHYWDPSIDIGQEVQGDMDIEIMDNVNTMFGNPNSTNVEKQPYIILAFRELVSNLREEAKKNGIPKKEYEKITADTDNQQQSGDRGKIELEGESAGKTNAILKLWKKDGKVWFNKSTKYCVITKDKETGGKRYPVAWANWSKRKNSYHGEAVGTYIRPNQMFINKIFAMVMMSLMHTAFPKAVYDRTLIDSWSNDVSTAIPANGDVTSVAKYLQPGQMSSQIAPTIDAVITYTKNFIGASDAALGQVKPENKGAIIAVQQAAAMPLENIEANMYQFVEDIGLIWLDFWESKYLVSRKVKVKQNGVNKVINFDGQMIKDNKISLKIDVGPSSYWSAITSSQALDNLLQLEKINMVQYLERVEDGRIPKRQALIDDFQQEDENQQMVFQLMTKFLDGMPPRIQQYIESLKEEEQEETIKQMMLMSDEELMSFIQQIGGNDG